MKELLQAILAALHLVGFPAVLFTCVGVAIFFVGLVSDRDQTLLYGGGTLAFVGLLFYHGSRIRGASVTWPGGPPAPLVSDWGALFLTLLWAAFVLGGVFLTLSAFDIPF